MATYDPNEKKEQEHKSESREGGTRPAEQAPRPAEAPFGRQEQVGGEQQRVPTQPGETRPAEVEGTEEHPGHPGQETTRRGARGTAAMDPATRREVARKGGLAVSRNRQHMAEIGKKGGQSVSKNREHMARIGRKGGAASRGHH